MSRARLQLRSCLSIRRVFFSRNSRAVGFLVALRNNYSQNARSPRTTARTRVSSLLRPEAGNTRFPLASHATLLSPPYKEATNFRQSLMDSTTRSTTAVKPKINRPHVGVSLGLESGVNDSTDSLIKAGVRFFQRLLRNSCYCQASLPRQTG